MTNRFANFPLTGALRIAAVLIAAAALLTLAASTLPTSAGSGDLVVNTTDDPGDGDCAVDGCTLREAIAAAPPLITFNIPGTDTGCAAGVCTITVQNILPQLYSSIDGTSQPGYAGDPIVAIDGSLVTDGVFTQGLLIRTDNLTVQGLDIHNFIGGAIDAANNMTGLTFLDNVLTGNGAPSTAAISIGGSGHHFSGNALADNLGDGIYAAFDGLVSEDMVFTNNEFTGNAGNGLEIYGPGFVVSGNLFSDNGLDGFHAGTPTVVANNDLVFTNNTVQDNFENGAYITALTATVTENTFTGNSKSGQEGERGMYFVGSGTASGNTFEDNVVNGVQLGGGYDANPLNFNSNTITSNGAIGVVVNSKATVFDNTISGNNVGIYIAPAANVIRDNTVVNNFSHGIVVTRGCCPPFSLLIGGPNGESPNIISGNGGAGVFVEGANAFTTGDATPQGVVYPANAISILGNITSGNAGLGIDLAPAGVTPNDLGDGDDGPNDLLNFPEIIGADAQQITGTACPDCTVELFLADNDGSGHGEGTAFIASAQAVGGAFTISICDAELASGDAITATATDGNGSTSEFSLNFTLSTATTCRGETPIPTAPSSPTPTTVPTGTPATTASPTESAAPSPTATGGAQPIWGDSDCSGAIGARDNQALLRNVLGQTALSQTEPCPDLGTSGPPVWGDWDCSGAISARDNQALLRHVLGQPALSQTEPCPDIGVTS